MKRNEPIPMIVPAEAAEFIESYLALPRRMQRKMLTLMEYIRTHPGSTQAEIFTEAARLGFKPQ